MKGRKRQGVSWQEVFKILGKKKKERVRKNVLWSMINFSQIFSGSSINVIEHNQRSIFSRPSCFYRVSSIINHDWFLFFKVKICHFVSLLFFFFFFDFFSYSSDRFS